jgi:hypothetical protein
LKNAALLIQIVALSVAARMILLATLFADGKWKTVITPVCARIAHQTMNRRTHAMSQAVNNVLNGVVDADDGVKRDQWGRYLLADPTTGEIIPWTRATTLAGCLDDTTSLDIWKNRNIVFGIGRRPDAYALAASAATTTDTEDKRTLDVAIHLAEEASQSSAKANLGTALHGFTQRNDLGEKNVVVPEQWTNDVVAYTDGFTTWNMWPHDNFIERVLLIPEIRTAGTVDRLLMADDWELPKIGDLKTGKVEGKGRSFAIQLAIYSRATHWHDPKDNSYHEMPAIDQAKGVIIHLPVGQGRCDFYEVDLVAGWEAALLANDVHQWRKRKDLCIPFAKKTDLAPTAMTISADTVASIPDEVFAPPGQRKAKSAKKAKNAVSSAEEELASTYGLDDKKAAVTEVEPDPLKVLADAAFVPPTHRTCEVCNESVRTANYLFHADNHLFVARMAWCLARVKYVAAEHGQQDELASMWSASCSDIPTFKQGGPRTHDEIDRVSGACALIETAHRLPFFEPDPKNEKHTTSKWIEGAKKSEQLTTGS